MARKPVEQKCIICDINFSSSVLKKTCSKKCANEYRSQKSLERYKDHTKIVACKFCEKKFKTKISYILKFCSKECYDNWQKVDGEEQNKIREKISNTLSGVSLRDRGYSKESIDAWKNAGQKASIEKCKGKKFEDYMTIEKAQMLRKHYSESRIGNKNSFYNKHHSIESKNKIVKNRKKEGYIYLSGYFNKIYWQSSYELAYIIYCYENDLNVRRYDLNPIEYTYLGKKHHYYPDFILNDNVIECKGFRNGQINAKIKAGYFEFKEKYIVLESKEIKNLGFSIPKKNIEEWYIEMIKKYNDLIKINYTPYKKIKEYLIENQS